MHLKKLSKKVLPLVLAGIMVFGTAVTSMAAEDPWSIADASKTELEYTIDGEKVKVTKYVDYYLKDTGYLHDNPNGVVYGAPYTYAEGEYGNAKVNVYIPEGANENTPIVYKVNNGGWMQNTYEACDALKEGQDYDSDEEIMAMCLKEGYVVVTAGLRTRGFEEDGRYNHAPVTVADAKAVVKYLKHNDGLVGDTDKIFLLGTSGGGALVSAVGASGNSADYEEELTNIGACMDETDDVFGIIAFCPITDLGNADGAYEFTYAAARDLMKNSYGFENSTVLGDVTMDISDDLAAGWADYVDSLGLKNEAGKALTADFDKDTLTASGTIYDGMKNLLIASLQEGLDEAGSVDAFKATLAERTIATGRDGKSSYGDGNGTLSANWTTDWLSFNSDFTKIVDIDMNDYMVYVALGQALKIAPAFTSEGTSVASQSENNLFGFDNEVCGFNNEIVWNLQTTFTADQYADWDAYWSAHKDTIEAQERMANSISYLVDDADGESAPYWYVRHGSVDRDTSFANQTLLYYSLINDQSIKAVDFKFEFNYGHKGDYEVPAVKTYIAESLEDAAASDSNTGNDDGTTPGGSDAVVTPPAGDNGSTGTGTSGSGSSSNGGSGSSTSPKTADSMGAIAIALIAAAGIAVTARKRVTR